MTALRRSPFSVAQKIFPDRVVRLLIFRFISGGIQTRAILLDGGGQRFRLVLQNDRRGQKLEEIRGGLARQTRREFPAGPKNRRVREIIAALAPASVAFILHIAIASAGSLRNRPPAIPTRIIR